VAAREAGFDLAIYHQYSGAVQTELKKRSIKSIMQEIADLFEDEVETPFSDLKQGVYIIAMSAPLTLKYKNKNSEVIYVGIGNVASRIQSHFEISLFDLMQSLSGADFDLKFAKPKKPYHTDYFKHVEYQMLEYFRKTAGELPLLNKNTGSNKDIESDDEWWATPLKGAGKKPRWALTALPGSAFKKLD